LKVAIPLGEFKRAILLGPSLSPANDFTSSKSKVKFSSLEKPKKQNEEQSSQIN
jgi:hypothetical protein